MFNSLAMNLSDDDRDGVHDVFARDLSTSTTTLVSRASGATGAAGDNDAVGTSVSADGRFVVFTTRAQNVSTEDNDSVFNVFVRDLVTDRTTLVSRASGADGAPGDGWSTDGAISADGRYVAFVSEAANLSSEDVDVGSNLAPVADVFVRDLVERTTTFVSRATGAMGDEGDRRSRGPLAISADGRRVAFNSLATNLEAGNYDAVNGGNAFVRDLVAHSTVLVNRATSGEQLPGTSSATSISADGRFVVVGNGVVYVRDLANGTTTLVSRATGNGPGAEIGARGGSMSADGRRVAFDSPANDLSNEDVDSSGGDASDAFVRDLMENTTTFVSRASGPAGLPGDRPSGGAKVSGDGRFVAFTSEATNLSADDDDARPDVFAREIVGPLRPPVPPVVSPPRDGVAPNIRLLSLSRRAFAVAPTPTAVAAQRGRRPARGTQFRYSLSERADVAIVIERRRPGVRLRRAGRLGCGVATRRTRATLRSQLRRTGLSGRALQRTYGRRACVVYGLSGQLTRAGHGPGAASTPFSGRIGRRALRVGRYRATVTATDAAGNRSRARRVAFRIVSGRRR